MSGSGKRGAGFGLDAELARKLEAKYDKKEEAAAIHWIECVTDVPFADTSFANNLKDGTVLCKLINSVKSGSVMKINESRMPFKQMENISSFLRACRAVGVAECDCFETADLYEEKDMGSVLRCLSALSRAARKIALFHGPYLDYTNPQPATSFTSSSEINSKASSCPSSTLAEADDGPVQCVAPSQIPSRPISPIPPPPVPLEPPALSVARPSPPPPGLPHLSETVTGNQCLLPQNQPQKQCLKEQGERTTPSHASSSLKFLNNLDEPTAMKASSAPQAIGKPQNQLLATNHAQQSPHHSAVAATVVNETDTTINGANVLPAHITSNPRGAGFGLDAEISRKLDAKYDRIEEAAAAQWIETVTTQKFSGSSFADNLKDGQKLCALMNAIKPSSIPKINQSAMPFKCMENISAFLRACRVIGVADFDCFETADLYDEKDLGSVLRCLYALSRAADKNVPGFQGPYIKYAKSGDKVNTDTNSAKSGAGIPNSSHKLW